MVGHIGAHDRAGLAVRQAGRREVERLVEAVVAKAAISLINVETNAKREVLTGETGDFEIPDLQRGTYRLTATASGFKTFIADRIILEGSQIRRINVTLEVGGVSEVVNVTSSPVNAEGENRRIEDQARKRQAEQVNAPSQNVFSLQRKVAGILPVRVDVPRAGRSYRFVRPLVVEEETKITFQYRAR